MSRHYSFKYEKQMHIMVGNIGSGKSTYVKNMEEDFVTISRDKIRYMLGNGKYVFIPELETSVFDGELEILKGLLKTGINIIIDETNMSDESRARYIKLAKKHKYEVTAVVFEKLSKSESVRRRTKDNHGLFSKKIWGEVWDRFNGKYVEPSEKEGIHNIIKIDNRKRNDWNHSCG